MKQIAYNKTLRKENPKYIVIHDTGNKSVGANAESHFRYFNTADRQSSADIFVDSSGELIVNDYKKYYTWHCGDGKGRNGITNANSVGIEMCVNKDGDFDKTVRHTINIVRRLMKELNIPASRVVRHFDASGKDCPASMCWNDWKLWKEFKKQIEQEEETPMTREERIKFNGLVEAMARLTEQVDKLSKPFVYNYIDKNMPEYARETVAKLVEKGVLKGNENGLNLDDNMLRMLVILDRARVFD